VAKTIFKILSTLSDARLVSTKEKDTALRAYLRIGTTTILKTGKPISFENSTINQIDIIENDGVSHHILSSSGLYYY